MGVRTYLVAEPVALIAEDLAGSIRECDATAEIIMAPPGPGLAALVPEGTALHMAFLHLDLADPQAPVILGAMQARGARVVLLGQTAGPETNDLAVLDFPFAHDSVARVLCDRAQTAPGVVPGA
ncbi:MAG: hypothetical protein KF887_19095 [Paracoccaceae bacterium]|nr:MAG: hypothetical protein KF887_19095 [Paracoccaceae bacterium]